MVLMPWQKALAVTVIVVAALSPVAPAQDLPRDLELPFTEAGGGRVDWTPFHSYVRFSHLMGDALGHVSNYTQLGSFTPLWQDSTSLTFVDAQITLTNERRYAGNVGYGIRRYSEEMDRVFGLSFWYDVDDGRRHTFQQMGMSLETYGRWLDARLNLDFPLTNGRKTTVSPFTNVRFVGNNVLADRVLTQTTPMDHVELMVGGGIPLPWVEEPSLRGYVGYYYLDGSDTPTANGVLGRLEGYTIPDLSFSVTLRHDAIHKTSALIGLTWVLPGGSPAYGSTDYTPCNRLALPVVRDYRIAVNHVEVPETVVATSTTTSSTINVAHVNSTAAAGGDGSFETPFSSFGELAASPTSYDLIIVGADTTYTNESIILADDQRLLGMGPSLVHQVATPLGDLSLPTSSGTALPVITGTTGNVVTLANNNEVSGFTITNPTGNAIFGNSISGFNVNNMVIMGAADEGILLQQVTGVGMITNATIDQNGTAGPTFASGIRISSASSRSLSLTMTDTTLNANGITPEMPAVGTHTGGDGLTLSAEGTATVDLMITNNTFTNNGAPIPPASVENTSGGAVTVIAGSGLSLTANATATLTGTVSNNQLPTNGCFGGGVTNTSGSLTISGGHGLVINGNGGSLVQLTVSNNTVNGNGFFGDLINNGDSLTVTGGSGIFTTVADGSTATMNLTMSNNNVTDNGYVQSALNSGTSVTVTGGSGIAIADGSSSLSTFSLVNNTIERSGYLTGIGAGVTTTNGATLIGELLNAAAMTCFEINGNTFGQAAPLSADYMLDNSVGGLFQVVDLNNINSNNTGANAIFTPGISGFTDVTGH